MIKELFNLEVSPCCLQKTLRTFTGHRSSGVEQQFRKLQVSGSIPLGGSRQLYFWKTGSIAKRSTP